MTLLALALSTTSWTLLVGGDIMLNGISPKSRPLAKIAALTRTADLAIANLEIPLTDTRKATRAKSAAELKARTQFVLKADPRHIKSIAGAGFDLFTLGNNHAMDYGASGLRQMTSLLAGAGIAHTGAGMDSDQAWKLAVVRSRTGIRVGVLSFLAFMGSGAMAKCTPARQASPGIAALQLNGVVDAKARARMRSMVEAAEAACDLLFIWPHWGIEKQKVPTAYQRNLARAWLEAGADGVFGAHPHVLQPYETVDGRPVFYSLGNLISPRPGTTALFRLTYEGTRLVRVEPIPASIRGGRVVPMADADSKRAMADLERLNGGLAPMKLKKP